MREVKTLQQLIELIGDLAIRLERKDAQICSLRSELSAMEVTVPHEKSDSRPRLHLAK